ncbi:hypothetical protein [Dactylosporangium sp. CA-092794]|uniref:hypothetical protein n=1 Tax=Dactylosporangium sp. CA-092794 TaxID=3239929 RepID=UPI003D8B1633
MREGFAHVAVLEMADEGDTRAPGGAITLALCGGWEHEPPCPLAAHHTATEQAGDLVRLRILFAADPSDEPEVRRRIDTALGDGQLHGPDGTITRWRLRESRADTVAPEETAHAARLAGDPRG